MIPDPPPMPPVTINDTLNPTCRGASSVEAAWGQFQSPGPRFIGASSPTIFGSVGNGNRGTGDMPSWNNSNSPQMPRQPVMPPFHGQGSGGGFTPRYPNRNPPRFQPTNQGSPQFKPNNQASPRFQPTNQNWTASKSGSVNLPRLQATGSNVPRMVSAAANQNPPRWLSPNQALGHASKNCQPMKSASSTARSGVGNQSAIQALRPQDSNRMIAQASTEAKCSFKAQTPKVATAATSVQMCSTAELWQDGKFRSSKTMMYIHLG